MRGHLTRTHTKPGGAENDLLLVERHEVIFSSSGSPTEFSSALMSFSSDGALRIFIGEVSSSLSRKASGSRQEPLEVACYGQRRTEARVEISYDLNSSRE